MLETLKSGNKISLGEIGLDISKHSCPKVDYDQVYLIILTEDANSLVSILCWHDQILRVFSYIRMNSYEHWRIHFISHVINPFVASVLSYINHTVK